MAHRTTGTGGYTPSEGHIVITASNYAGGGHPVIVCHGGGGLHDQYAPIAQRRDLNVLADTGLVVCAADLGGAHTWGNDAGTAAVDALLAWLATAYDTDNSKVVFVADSHGALTAINWATRNAAATAAMVLRVPAVALDAAHDRDVGGLADTIEGCYNALTLPGVAGAYASTPDHASLDITGPIDVRAQVALADWTPTGLPTIIGKWGASGGANRSWQLTINSTGTLRWLWTADGTTQIAENSTVAPTVTDGDTLCVRSTFVPDNGSGQRVTNFYTAPTLDGPWTQLGATVTTAGATSIFSGNAPIEVGSSFLGASTLLTGAAYGAEIRDGVDGIVVADPDFRQATATTTFDDSTGKTWTRNGTATYEGYEAALPTHDPSHATMVAQQISLGLVPKMRAWYDSADPIVLPAEVEAWAAATGVDLYALSAAGTHEPWSKVHAHQQAAWIWGRLAA